MGGILLDLADGDLTNAGVVATVQDTVEPTLLAIC